MLARILAAGLLLASLASPVSVTPASAAPALSDAEVADILYTREEEKVARDSYLTLDGLWGLDAFANIAEAEQSHMDAMLVLIERYALIDPVGNNPVGVFTDPRLQSLYDNLMASGRTSSLAALEVGGVIEETDLVDIAAAVARSQHTDITKTYDTLMCGSRNHLRGFAQAIQAATGQPYVAQVLPQATVDTILASPDERCGRGATRSTQSSAGRSEAPWKGRP